MKTNLLTALFMLAIAAQSVHANIIVEETFTYGNGNIAGLNGGIGWNGGWEAGNSTGATRFTIDNNQAIFQSGNATIVRQHRGLASPITIGVGDTYTITLDLIRPDDALNRSIGIELVNEGATLLGLGKRPNAGVGLHTGLGGAYSNIEMFSNAGDFTSFVVDLTYDGTNTIIAVSSPNLGQTLDAYTYAGQLSFDGINLVGLHGTTNGIDNLSISIVPEPTSGLLLGAGAGLLMLRRRRQRQQ